MSGPPVLHERAEAAGYSLKTFLMHNLVEAYSRYLRATLPCTDLWD